MAARASYRIEAIRQGITTAYLVKGSGPWVQIDTGYRGDLGKRERRMARLGVDPAEVGYLILTHHHDDHAGYLAELVRRTPGVRVIMGRETAGLVRAGVNNTANGGGLVTRRVALLFSLMRRLRPGWDLTFPPYDVREADIVVAEDEWRLPPELGLGARLVWTPGHTSDSISLLTDDGDLFCGDAAANMLRFAGTRHATVFNEDMEAVYATWRWVLEAGVRRIYPAHGRPFGPEALRRNLDRFRTEDLVAFAQ